MVVLSSADTKSNLVAPSASSSSTAGGGDEAPSDSRTLESAASEMHHPPPRSSLAMLSSSAGAAVTGCCSPSAAAFGPLAIDEAHRCRYKTGKCRNARSSKRNGQPHQLCLYHRDKANQIQRKFDRQKRQVIRERKNSGSASTPSSTSSSSSSPVPSSSSTALSNAHHGHFQQLQYLQPHHQQRRSLTSTRMLSAAMLPTHQHHQISAATNQPSTGVHNITNFAPRFTSLAAKDVDLYSDSEASSRFSTDSSSSDSSSLWADLPSPVSAAAFMGLRLAPVAPSPPSSLRIETPSPAPRTPNSVVGLRITPTAASSAQGPHPLSHDEIDFLCSAMLE
ncbi:hypothetical protein PybrP1_005216 [[Pythium] brassicae (nom. inval.)]|nr:hypothetical protein PybrP1_005216 [[Pythium] brassicae (nom. inval.)]